MGKWKVPPKSHVRVESQILSMMPDCDYIMIQDPPVLPETSSNVLTLSFYATSSKVGKQAVRRLLNWDNFDGSIADMKVLNDLGNGWYRYEAKVIGGLINGN